MSISICVELGITIDEGFSLLTIFLSWYHHQLHDDILDPGGSRGCL